MFGLILSALLSASEPGVASAPAPQSPVAKETDEPKRKICRRQQVTGQLQGTKRVCMTPEQWKRLKEESPPSRR